MIHLIQLEVILWVFPTQTYPSCFTSVDYDPKVVFILHSHQQRPLFSSNLCESATVLKLEVMIAELNGLLKKMPQI